MTGQQKRSADDLEDEFVFQDVGVSESENEEQQHEFQVDALDEEQEGFAVNNDEGNDSVLGPASSTSLSATKTKSQKKRQISKEKKKRKMEIILEKQCNLTPQSLWDEFMSDMKSKKGMSSLELQDLEDKSKWNETSFLDLSNCFNQERTSETLWTAIEKAAPAVLDRSSKKSNGPRILVVCSGAIRCIDIIKNLRDKSNKKIAKLFAKHMKVQEQVDFIKSHQQSILCGVGTPNRILKVWEEMKNQDFIDNVDLVVLDSSFVDQKKRTLITLEECRGDVWTLLSKTATLNNTENQKKIKLIIF